MKTKVLFISTLVGVLAITGCVSVDRTRAQLKSKDTSEVKKAEDTIYAIATTGQDSSGLIKYTIKEQVEYVQLASNQELLLKIIDDAHDGEIVATAAERLDFSKKGVAASFVRKGFTRLGRVDAGRKKSLKEKAVAKLTREEIIDLIGKEYSSSAIRQRAHGSPMGREPYRENAYDDGRDCSSDRDMLIARLIDITDSPTDLLQMLNGYIGGIDIRSERSSKEHMSGVKKRLESTLEKMTDVQTITKILAEKEESGRYLVRSVDQRILLLKKLPEDKMVELILSDIDKYRVAEWNNDNLVPLEIGINVIPDIKDEKSSIKIIASILSELAKCRKECETSGISMSWNNEDEKKVAKLLAALPPLPDTVITALVCLDGSTWKYLIERVSAENAYDILSHGNANNEELEIALIKKLSPRQADMKVFSGVKTDAGKKAVMAMMPPDVKNAVQESQAKAFSVVMDKAKVASKETFEMHGFYLDMSLDDMKLVLSHHFPELKIIEGRDGDKKDGDYMVYIAEEETLLQETPFCYASAEDKKIYQFNFGKRILKKWYKYDVQNYSEWARAYSRENKIDMRYSTIQKTIEAVHDLQFIGSAFFRQEIWQYKYNSKKYKVVYFGERKITDTSEDVIRRGLVAAAVADKTRYLSADEGTLRVQFDDE